MKKDIKNNPLLCDPITGICEVPGQSATESLKVESVKEKEQKIQIIYFTDPICSSCWGIEPQLRKLKLEYGSVLDISYKMGGLLANWDYNSGGISKPSDVAAHWDEVSIHYDMPIDGDLWLEDPMNSSFPPSIAYKAAELQDKNKAILFMREMREMMFLKKKNLTKWENMATAAQNVGLNVEQLKEDYENNGDALFKTDLELARTFGVRGFPTIYFIDNAGNQEKIYGAQPYSSYENALLKLDKNTVKQEYNKDWQTLFSYYNSLTAKEFSVLSGMPRIESEDLLTELANKNQLETVNTKNGALWILKKK